jgi:serine/threonine-protein kinase
MQVGYFQILSKLGSGGMGEVYRARDTKLGRDVALKVLPEIFSGDPERMSRFRREAHVLAALNHPNIAAIYGVEDSSGHPALVLDFIDGETLAERIHRGPIPLAEALIMIRPIPDTENKWNKVVYASTLRIVLNWTDELQRLMSR